MSKKSLPVVFILGILAFTLYYHKFNNTENNQTDKKLKLYWFIPDGLRAEPDLKNFHKSHENKVYDLV